MTESRVVLLVPRPHVKAVKSMLEEHDLLDRTVKITPEPTDPHIEKGHGANKQWKMAIPTKFLVSTNENFDEELQLGKIMEVFEKEHRLGELTNNISVKIDGGPVSSASDSTKMNPVLKALDEYLHSLPPELLSSLDPTSVSLLSAFPTTYSVYKPMLLLPTNATSSPPWTKFLSNIPQSEVFLLWKRLAEAAGVTHVAQNSPIPLQNPTSKPADEASRSSSSTMENILRSPTGLTPLYGDFGPPSTPFRQENPTEDDFNSTLWVQTRQNGIWQTWAPQYTMFSRGNIREKTRLLTLPSVATVISEGKRKGKYIPDPDSNDVSLFTADRRMRHRDGCAAVDLYAGIGYFAFSYKKAGISQILCWDLNPWSIEGLRRGAALNGWSSQIFTKLPSGNEGWEDWKSAVGDTDFLVFRQANESAFASIAVVKDRIPPVRHVNCGFLPSSKDSWGTAVRVVDGQSGGWIHAHENVGMEDIDKRGEEIENEFQHLVDELDAEKGGCRWYRRRAICEHVEKVKTYAPGVMHCVFDVWVAGKRDQEQFDEFNQNTAKLKGDGRMEMRKLGLNGIAQSTISS
ncbi:hypothetical protein K469DRAFT_90957 [Zopfia rhizophila CBS 207.26]|uniref:tRNA(Phe) (4-demethylwyosine(37)-C(7)) aminocarboxypropyltransferase n=1 Tax=Zopfia rhizophila CBS 207.26 TaxID=1314779 RepID=A0A6A6E8I6_9PEZI|nr:hypothetical protein K469DRAFT_90957 [Zopfia rhizophila CBS 207.26]